jgi:hypothetical protein
LGQFEPLLTPPKAVFKTVGGRSFLDLFSGENSMKNLNLTGYARAEGISRVQAYNRVWAGKVPGAHKDSDGHWVIPYEVEEQTYSQPIPGWKSRAAGRDE